MHSLTELLISSLVFVLKLLIILLLSINTESVFVPPTSIPILIIFLEFLVNFYNQSHNQILWGQQLLMLF